MGDSEAMVAEGYTSAPNGDYNVSAASVESTGQENVVNQSNAPSVDSSQSLNNASLVNGTGHESGLSAPVENGNATEHRDQLGSTLLQTKKKSTSHIRVRSLASLYDSASASLGNPKRRVLHFDSNPEQSCRTRQDQFRDLDSIYKAEKTPKIRVRSLASICGVPEGRHKQIGQEIAFTVNQRNAPNVDSSLSVNNASLVNGTGPEGSLSAPVENGNATEHRDQLGFDYISCIDSLASDTTTHPPQIRDLTSIYEASERTQKKEKSTSHLRVRSLASICEKERHKQISFPQQFIAESISESSEKDMSPSTPKKHFQRPRVAYNKKSDRMWELFMQNNKSHLDTEEVKLCEEECNLFQERIKSFLAQMRLLQGNRSFTPWKGSVVDSVIGVILTQNVGDHLSSSAFMSLAAEFPVRTISSDEATMDSVDWNAVRTAGISVLSKIIKDRGMYNKLAGYIQAFLKQLMEERRSIDLEWLKGATTDVAKEYLMKFLGMGQKSVECVRLLALHQCAFPVDTNVARIATRLGLVPLQPFSESLPLHLLKKYPDPIHIQNFLWQRLCNLDQKTLYELHYHMITFGKVFCTEDKPNCSECPMKRECKYFASAFSSERPEPECAQIPDIEDAFLEDTALRTKYQVYKLPDEHPLLEKLENRKPGDSYSYLLAIWTPGDESARCVQPADRKCISQKTGELCDEETCFSCNNIREVGSQTAKGTFLIPCKSAMRGRFPLNGTYFQVNEVFADHASNRNPIDVPRKCLLGLSRSFVYFGTSVSSICKGLSREAIEICFFGRTYMHKRI